MTGKLEWSRIQAGGEKKEGALKAHFDGCYRPGYADWRGESPGVGHAWVYIFVQGVLALFSVWYYLSYILCTWFLFVTLFFS